MFSLSLLLKCSEEINHKKFKKIETSSLNDKKLLEISIWKLLAYDENNIFILCEGDKFRVNSKVISRGGGQNSPYSNID
jgi:hypothetical protein